MNRDQIILKLSNKINQKRLEHSIGVEYTAAAMAMAHGEDIEKARLAGILHDCAKGYSTEEKLKIALKHNILINDYERSNPDMLHAKLGAYYAKSKYEVTDTDVLNAICYHTTGRPDMSKLEKIIFIADYIEPNRKPQKEMEEIRQEAFIDLNKCVLHILKNTLEYLRSSSDSIDEMTQKTYDFYNNNGGA